MTFTIYSTSVLVSLLSGWNHVAVATSDVWKLPTNLALSALAIISYHIGLRAGCFAREPPAERALPPSEVSSPLSPKLATLPVVVMPTLTSDARQYAKLQAAIKSVLATGATLIVVDDASPMDIKPLCHGEERVLYVRHETNLGPGAARNTGARLALKFLKPTFIAFTDSDCVVNQDWLNVHARHQREQPGVWCGQTAALDRDTSVGQYHDLMGTLNGRRWTDAGSLLYGPSCNMSVAASVMSKHRFDERFPGASFEDVEFCVRAIKNGIHPRYAEDALVMHDYESSLGAFAKQFYRYGTSYPLMSSIHAEVRAGDTHPPARIETPWRRTYPCSRVYAPTSPSPVSVMFFGWWIVCHDGFPNPERTTDASARRVLLLPIVCPPIQAPQIRL